MRGGSAALAAVHAECVRRVCSARTIKHDDGRRRHRGGVVGVCFEASIWEPHAWRRRRHRRSEGRQRKLYYMHITNKRRHPSWNSLCQTQIACNEDKRDDDNAATFCAMFLQMYLLRRTRPRRPRQTRVACAAQATEFSIGQRDFDGLLLCCVRLLIRA